MTSATADASVGAGADGKSAHDVPEPKKEEKVRVAVRMRPLNAFEADHSKAWRIDAQDHTILQTNAAGEHEPGMDLYKYGHTFDEQASNQDVYEAIGNGIVKDVLKGYDGTIFTYGQTSSGKTYTMQGSGENRGMLQMAASDVFDHMHMKKDESFVVKVSFIEIYNEVVNDLLVSGDQDATLTVRAFSVGAIKRVVTSMDSLLEVLSEGEKNRSVGSTKMNDESSRSHTIFMMAIESASSDGGRSSVSTLNLVDLAGSESVRHTGATGDRKKEAGNINSSLLVLSRVITILGENSRAQSIPPFRESKLTEILKRSLSGEAKLAVVCCATPSGMYLNETRTTLQFADRAQLVKTKATKSRRRLTEGGGRRSSIAPATPLKRVTGFLSPKRLLGSAKKRCPKTDGRVRGKRSVLFSAIPEDSSLQKDMKIADLEEKIVNLEARLKSTIDSALQKDAIIADFEQKLGVLEKKLGSTAGEIDSDGDRRESYDSDATVEFVIAADHGREESSSQYNEPQETNDENKSPNEGHLAPVKADTPSIRKPTRAIKECTSTESPVRKTRGGRTRRKTERYTPNKKMAPSSTSSMKPLPEKEVDENADFGLVGYRYQKYFGSRWGSYDGEVVEVLSDGSVRCFYPADPDNEEILSLDELPKRPPKGLGKKSAKKDDVSDITTKDLGRKGKQSLVTDEAKEEVRARAKAGSRAAVAEMREKGEESMWLNRNVNCHICKKIKPVVVTFHCGKLTHSYCDTHCKKRLGFSAIDYDSSKPNELPIDYCPVCALSCECSKCKGKLETDARNVNRLCVSRSVVPLS